MRKTVLLIAALIIAFVLMVAGWITAGDSAYGAVKLRMPDAKFRAEMAVMNRAFTLSFRPPWQDVEDLEILHRERCERVSTTRVNCKYNFSFKRADNGKVKHIESGTVYVTPHRAIIPKADTVSKRRGITP